MQNIAILGSTGSIGRQALDVISRHPDRYRAVALAARSSAELLQEQVRVFRPETAVLTHPPKGFGGTSECEWNFGEEALLDVCARADVDAVLVAVVGIAGLPLVLRAVACGKKVLLANKEALVTGGELVMRAAKDKDVPLLPVDSEHSAIFQCIQGRPNQLPCRIVLTASGGPFRGRTRDDLRDITPAQALKHPTWHMGAKISIDSSTLMNKGLEVIEAHHLFNMPYDKIEVVVQPQSAIHSMVEYADGSVKAHLGTTDMRIPIQFALSYPDRWEAPVAPLDFRTLGSLEFAAPDEKTFRCLALARHAGSVGGTLPCVMNAANEIAVAAFLSERGSYLGIAECVEAVMSEHESQGVQKVESIEQLQALDAWARAEAEKHIR